ncbi:hypothetical protein E2562_010382 [Oryza meyeriana var. granulata]|uniref:AAA+ ATPase domain-containing protein n=1 Tax=Oryza meyeriana var. granulata TaxID=110450 RepID=A0A6G1F6E5_9ORYZ|nr:hypothetical protein E2562_010382 [Oryza meyeriana var. granulata]
MLYWLFLGKDLDSRLRALVDDKVCQFMSDCIVVGGVVEVYPEEPIVVDVSDGDEQGNDYELEMEEEADLDSEHASQDGNEQAKEGGMQGLEDNIEAKKRLVGYNHQEEPMFAEAAKDSDTDCDYIPEDNCPSDDEEEADNIHKQYKELKKKIKAGKAGNLDDVDFEGLKSNPIMQDGAKQGGNDTPYKDSDSEQSIDKIGSDGEVTTRTSQYSRFKDKPSVPQFELRMKFSCKSQFRKAITSYALSERKASIESLQLVRVNARARVATHQGGSATVNLQAIVPSSQGLKLVVDLNPPPPRPRQPAAAKGKTGTATLDAFGRNLTAEAVNADPVVGREEEIDRVVCILSRKSKNSAVLVGAAGVGKTANAEVLAQRIARGEVSGVLVRTRVVELNVAAMISSTSFRGTFEERVMGVIAEVEAAAAGKVVLFVDEIPMLLGAGRVQGSSIDASNIEDDTVAIFRRLKPSYQKHHGMEIEDSALVAAAKLSGRNIPARHFPDKAIDLVDEGCATARLLMDRRKKKQAQAQAGSNGAAMPVAPKDENVGADHIAQIVSKLTGIPVASLGEDERKKLLELPRLLHRRVIGRDEAVAVVAEAVVRSRSGLGNPNQPSGSFLFLGPTGVGKTELAKALAEQLFGNDKLLVRIDMSEYVNASSVTRLIGSAPGTCGQLTELVRQRPYSVVLFDEVEKADADVFNVFLQILDDRRLTDGQGRTVDFTNTIIIMTSNLGAEHLAVSASQKDAMEAAK